MAIGALQREILLFRAPPLQVFGQSLLLWIFNTRFQMLISPPLGMRIAKRGILKKSASHCAKKKYQSQLNKVEIKAHLRSGEFNQEAHFLTECHRPLFSLLEFSTSAPKDNALSKHLCKLLC